MENKISKEGWEVVNIEERVDSFNQQTVIDKIQMLLKKNKAKIVLNMHQVHFISLPVIKFLSETAKELRTHEGSLALVGISEKLKRQIGIYASLDNLMFCRSEEEIDHLDLRLNQVNQGLVSSGPTSEIIS
ncbi:MAG: STAS domain-containing protein [Bdellovibrionales bacterium]|nr:STAS domain-containing protein [Bdellovibrionales bacterium]